MKKTAVIFVTDGGFLVPTLVVCRQLLAQGAAAHADLIVYLVDVAQDVRDRLAAHFDLSGGIRFEVLASKAFVPGDSVQFYQNHVPVVSLARLILHEHIPEAYEHIVYLDGDLQITGDVTPLLQYAVPEGRIAAARGALWLEASSAGSYPEWVARYAQGLGDIDADEYFNAGVMAFRRRTWCEIAPAALKFFFEHSQACIRHDQSALNAVCKGRRIDMAPAYNFHFPYAELYVQQKYAPRIVHFTGPNKPWRYEGLPWGKRFTQSYDDVLTDHDFLENLLTRPARPPAARRLRRVAQYAKGGLQLMRRSATVLRHRRRFFSYVENTQFAF